jgi:hypothetical protein
VRIGPRAPKAARLSGPSPRVASPHLQMRFCGLRAIGEFQPSGIARVST